MKMSTIDQRPTCSMIRYIRPRSRNRQVERRCTVIRRKVSPISFSTGTVMLAKNTSSATGHIPAWISCLTPERMVSGSPRPK